MSERIAVFGDKESVYGFAALGLDTYFFDPSEDYVAVFKKLCQSKSYTIIYITEAAAAFLDKEIAKYRSEPSPAIILIPGVTGNTGEGLSAIRISVEKAVGSDIFNE
ncbi:V-type ATP synthase subunit F [Ruminococcus sp.]|uniref:V-type ATP synthase subunit F n=1 Tax=Ruminococcus sp. TaxID=41978 RepID=UPI00388F3CB5